MLICSDCGHASPDGFRFCGACGAEMPVGTHHEVRKTVTVLFADLTGFRPPLRQRDHIPEPCGGVEKPLDTGERIQLRRPGDGGEKLGAEGRRRR